MTDLTSLPSRDEEGNLNVVVEAPRGSRVKLAFEPERKIFVFKRALPLGLSYPHDWGFIAGTLAPDGDPLDAMVFFDAPTWPGTVIASRPVGVVRLTEKHEGKRERNDRLIVVPAHEERFAGPDKGVPPRARADLEAFFAAMAAAAKKTVVDIGWGGEREAEALVKQAEKARPGGASQSGDKRKKPKRASHP